MFYNAQLDKTMSDSISRRATSEVQGDGHQMGISSNSICMTPRNGIPKARLTLTRMPQSNNPQPICVELRDTRNSR